MIYHNTEGMRGFSFFDTWDEFQVDHRQSESDPLPCSAPLPHGVCKSRFHDGIRDIHTWILLKALSHANYNVDFSKV